MSPSNRNRDDMSGALVRRDAPSALEKAAPIDFADHAQFHVTVGRAVAGGATAAFLTEIGANLVGFSDAPAGMLMVAVTTGVMAAVAARSKKWWRAAFGGAMGAVGSTLYLLTGDPWPVFAGALLGAAAAPVLARGETWKRMAVTGAVAGAFGSAGLYVAEWMQNIGLLNGVVPGPLGAAAAGAAAGLFFGLSAAPKHIARPSDQVEERYLEALQIKDGELHEILARALSIHQSLKTDLAHKKDEKTLQKLSERVGEMAMRVLAIAEQCRRVEADLSSAPAFELEERIASLRRKADAATDASARETYLSAVESLDGQRRAFDQINRGRERVIARLHANVALLEKVRFSLLHMRSADAERIGGEASPLSEALEELSRELDVTSTAVGEVFGKPPPREHRSELPAAKREALPAPASVPSTPPRALELVSDLEDAPADLASDEAPTRVADHRKG